MRLPTRRPGRRVLLAGAALLTVLVVAVAAVLLLRGNGPEDVAEDYLRATWTSDPATECELATDQWRHYLYEGEPYADCAAFAKAAGEAREKSVYERFRADTDVTVTVESVSQGDGRARVAYQVDLLYHGKDQAGFDELWQGGGPRDRGTIELVEVDATWRIAGVDAG